MTRPLNKVVVIGGVGEGLSLALIRLLLEQEFLVAGLSRSGTLIPELGNHYLAVSCDLTEPKAVDAAISKIESTLGQVEIYIHNAAYLFRHPFLETSSDQFTDLWRIICLGAIHGTQRVLPNMLKAKNGAVLMIGASASLKGGREFSAFSAAKFALRGLTQSLSREFSPQGIHIAHLVIDGPVWGKQAIGFGRSKEECLLPEAIAETCLHLIQQHHSTWTQELDLRPDIETF